MSHRRRVVLVVASLLVGAPLLLPLPPAVAQEAEGEERALPRTPHAREIRSLVRALGDPQWGVREAARRRLTELGAEATPWLERATRDPDPERATQAAELLEIVRWQVPEALRAAVGEDLDDWPGLTPQQKLEGLGKLAQLEREASAAAPFLVTVARFDPGSEIRQAAVEVYLRLTPGGDPTLDRQALEALADEPEGQPRPHLLRARLARRLGRAVEAVAHAREAHALAPAPPVTDLLIDLLIEADRHAEALPLAETRAKEVPGDGRARIRVGEILLHLGREEEGLAELASVLELEGVEKDLDVLLRLGQAYLRTEHPAEAEQVYRDALGRFPYSHELNVARADVHAALDRPGEALAIYLSEIRYAAPGTPAHARLRQRLGDLLAEGGAGWVREVDAFFEDAHRGRPLRDVHLKVAEWLRVRGLVDEAVRSLRLVCALSPDDAETRVQLGDLLRDRGALDQARAAYEEALALVPGNAAVEARLRDVEALASAPPPPAADAEEGSFAFWEARVGAVELSRGTESPTERAPRPLVLADRVVVPAAGVATLFGLDAQDGRLRWRYEPEPPPPESGALPEQTGLEPAALVDAPPAVVAAVDPARARRRTPLVAAFYNVWWRPAHRSWRKAAFEGLRVYLFDPADGAHIAVLEVESDGPLSLRPEAVARGGRVLGLFEGRRGRALDPGLVDLVLARPLWIADGPRGALRRPLFTSGRLVLAWDRGVVALSPEGRTAWRHDLDPGPAEAAEDEGEAPGPAARLTAGLALQDQGVVYGTSDGRLVRLGLDDGAATELARPCQGRLTSVVAGDGRLYAAERGGPIHAVDVSGDAARTAWTHRGPETAFRTLAWAGGTLFSINGSVDVFAGEVPQLVAFDPATGAPLLERPVDRPATLAGGADLVVVSSGGRAARAGLRVIGVSPKDRIDARTAALVTLESAARDALVEGQYEVSAVLAREYVRRAGGHDLLDQEGLAFVARTLGRSNRAEEALDLIHRGEERALNQEETAFWDDLRRDLGLGLPEPLTPVDESERPPEAPPGEEAPPEDGEGASEGEPPPAPPAEGGPAPEDF